MKRWFLLLIPFLLIAGTASAYEIAIEAPPSIYAGETLLVNGTSNLPAGTTVEIIFSRAGYTSDQLASRTVTIQGNGIPFNMSFETIGFPRGTYKIEVQPIGGYSYLGDSVPLRVVELIDRSNELTVRTQLSQYFDGTLDIDGVLEDNHKEGAQVTVIGPDGDQVISGPAFVATNNDGYFSTKVSVPGPGLYRVRIDDSKGYIGTVQFKVLSADNPLPDTTPPTGQETTARPGASLSASAPASRDNPAYFAVTSSAGRQTQISTDAGIDWVIEYLDERGVRQKVNENGAANPEVMTISGTGNVTYLMISPYKYSDQGTVTVRAENAEGIQVSPAAATMFAAAATATTVPAPTSSPVGILTGLAAVAAAGLATALRRR